MTFTSGNAPQFSMHRRCSKCNQSKPLRGGTMLRHRGYNTRFVCATCKPQKSAVCPA